MSTADLPSSVYRVLELLAGEPHVRHKAIPPDLQNALRIARSAGLIETEMTSWGELRGRAYDAYAGSLNVAYWLSASGKDCLALHHEQRADTNNREPATAAPGNAPKSEVSSAAEEWLPAAEAVRRIERAGHTRSLKWLTTDAPRCGIRIRERQLPGRHKVEVEWNSLAGYLLKSAPEEETDEEAIGARLAKERERKRRDCPLD
jgi:hypothetical protein